MSAQRVTRSVSRRVNESAPQTASAPAPRSRVPAERAHTVSVSLDGATSPVAVKKLEELAARILEAEQVPRGLLSITLISSRAMARLNREHLGHRGATDVITFALGDDGSGVLVADIYICPEVARNQAAHFRSGIREEVARLVVHGVLHACGWDHPVDEQREGSPMWQRQERLLARWRKTQTTPA